MVRECTPRCYGFPYVALHWLEQPNLPLVDLADLWIGWNNQDHHPVWLSLQSLDWLGQPRSFSNMIVLTVHGLAGKNQGHFPNMVVPTVVGLAGKTKIIFQYGCPCNAWIGWNNQDHFPIWLFLQSLDWLGQQRSFSNVVVLSPWIGRKNQGHSPIWLSLLICG